MTHNVRVSPKVPGKLPHVRIVTQSNLGRHVRNAVTHASLAYYNYGVALVVPRKFLL